MGSPPPRSPSTVVLISSSDSIEKLELFMIFIENISNAEEEIYSFVANVAEKSVQELKEMDADVFINLIKQIFLDEKIQSFFTTALK